MTHQLQLVQHMVRQCESVGRPVQNMWGALTTKAKYMYGPATVNTDNDGVIGSSIQGRIESGIGIGRLTTIIMPMKGVRIHNNALESLVA
jgi:hypothetical protein